jgi:hypothetical protein
MNEEFKEFVKESKACTCWDVNKRQVIVNSNVLFNEEGNPITSTYEVETSPKCSCNYHQWL